MPPEFVTCIQCTDVASGEVGTFIRPAAGGPAVSPVFPDLAALYPWMRANGWTHDPGLAGGCRPPT